MRMTRLPCPRARLAGNAIVSVAPTTLTNKRLFMMVPSTHDRFVFEEFLDAEPAPLAADTRQLEPSVCAALVERRAVDPYAAGAQLGCDRASVLRVAAPDTTCKAVGRVVGDGNRVGLVLERNDHYDGPED